jgi:hypothetical protein
MVALEIMGGVQLLKIPSSREILEQRSQVEMLGFERHFTEIQKSLRMVRIARHWWLMPVTLNAQEAEIRRITV